MRCSPLLIVFCLAYGCAERPEPLAEPPSEPQKAEASPAGGGDGIGIVSPIADPASPVTGGGASGGSGGADVGNVLKKKAQDTADKESSEPIGDGSGANDGT